MSKIRIAIVEDLEEVADGIVAFFHTDTYLELVGNYRTAEAAEIELPLTKPDIVIMDINLPGISGIQCIKNVKANCPSTKFLMFTVFENNDQVFDALKAGATGYILKKTAPAQIIEAVKDLYNGGAPMSATIAKKLLSVFLGDKNTDNNKESDKLSVRENEILKHLAKGLLYKEIADELNISFHTVRQHIHNIYEKLHVQNKVEAINKVFGK
jgi:DNA-binding NarL/FixJ family response regulator